MRVFHQKYMTTKSKPGEPEKVIVHYGESLDEVGKRFVDAWHHAESAERMHETHLGFEDLEDLAQVLTPKRLALLRAVHAHPAKDVRALSKALDRNYKNVHDDVTMLAKAGLLVREGRGVYTPYDVITAEARL